MSYLLNSPLVLEGLCGRCGVSSSLLWIWNKIQNKIYKYNTKKKRSLKTEKKWIRFSEITTVSAKMTHRCDSGKNRSHRAVGGGMRVERWQMITHTTRTSSMSKELVFLVRSCDSWSSGRPQGALSGVEVRFASSSTSALLTAWLSSSSSLRTPDWGSPDSASCSLLAAAGGPMFLGSGLSGGQDIGKFKYLCVSLGDVLPSLFRLFQWCNIILQMSPKKTNVDKPTNKKLLERIWKRNPQNSAP